MYTVLINERIEEGLPKGMASDNWQLIRTAQADESNEGMPTWATRENALKFIEEILPNVGIDNLRLAKLIDLKVSVETADQDDT